MANEEKKKAEIVTQEGATGFPIVDVADAHDAMLGAFDQLGISSFNLSKLSIPAGGMTAFEVDDPIKGQSVEQTVRAVIACVKAGQKAWWSTSVEDGGAGSPPDCKSEDGVTGFGNNTLEPTTEAASFKCATCPWNQWESNRGGGMGKDCQDHSLMFFFMENRRLPTVLKVPATSLKALQRYAMALIDHGKRLEGVITEISLKKATSRGGIVYSELDLRMIEELPVAEGDHMKAVATSLKDRLLGFDAFAVADEA